MAEKDEKSKKNETKEKVVEKKIDKKAKESTTSEDKSKKADEKKEKNLKDEIKEKAEGIEEKLNIDTDELKNETKDTVNQVKEVFSNGDFKEKTTEATHFVKGAFTNPFETIEEIATEKNEVFSKTVLLIFLFVILSFATSVFGVFRLTHFNFLKEFSSFISSITTPVLFILVPSVVIYLFNISNRRKMTTVISTVTTCYIPIIIASACLLLRKIVPDFSLVTDPVILTCKALSVILLYFGIKNILDENDDKHYMKKFLLIYVIIQLIFVILLNLPIIFQSTFM